MRVLRGSCDPVSRRKAAAERGHLPDDHERSKIYPVTAAATVATGRGIEASDADDTHSLGVVERLRHYPDQELHLIMDNYATHKHPKIKAWLAATPRIHVHCTPTPGSWLNLVEIWFSNIERQAIHRDTFASVRELMIKIRTFINGWNDRSKPFVWTKTADQILPESEPSKNFSCDPLDRPGAIVSRYQ